MMGNKRLRATCLDNQTSNDLQTPDASGDDQIGAYEWSDDLRPSTAAVLAVADHLDVDPEKMDQPLYEVTDPDALDSLFGPDGADGVVTFSFCGVDVTVHSGGRVVVRSAEKVRERAAIGAEIE